MSAKEFRVVASPIDDGLRWIVEWCGADSRAVAYCFNRREADDIAKALNAHPEIPAGWVKRARAAIARGKPEGTP